MQQDGDDVQAGEERQQDNGFEDDLQDSHVASSYNEPSRIFDSEIVSAGQPALTQA
jgi:hypothetical protein